MRAAWRAVLGRGVPVVVAARVRTSATTRMSFLARDDVEFADTRRKLRATMVMPCDRGTRRSRSVLGRRRSSPEVSSVQSLWRESGARAAVEAVTGAPYS